LYGADVFLIAIGEGGGREGEGAYAAGEEGTYGEYGTPIFGGDALAGVCNCPCGVWCGARAVLRRGGCTARRLRGDICGAA